MVLGMIDPCDVMRTTVIVFVTPVRSPLSYLLLGDHYRIRLNCWIISKCIVCLFVV